MSDSSQLPTVVWALRHGETDWNAAGRIQGQSDQAELTKLGMRQALGAARELRMKPIDAIYTSDLYRARQTSAVVAGQLGCLVHADSRLRERSFGVVEGRYLSQLTPEITGIDRGVIVDPEARAPGGETLDDVRSRCTSFLRWLAVASGHREVVVVAHGGSIRMMQLVAAGTRSDGWPWSVVANASIHRLTVPVVNPLDPPVVASLPT